MSLNLILGSSSDYRRRQLSSLGFKFKVIAPTVDETPLPSESGEHLASRLARLKAESIPSILGRDVIIGADQVAICQETILDKPLSIDKAVQQLSIVSGKSVLFLSAVCIIGLDGKSTEHVELTRVYFRQLTPAEIKKYVELDQPLHSAGALKSESRGLLLFDRVESNDPSVLIGLPLIHVTSILRSIGINPLLQ